MALYKRGKTWWISFTHNGQRIQRSTGTTNKVAAREYHDKAKAELWRVTRLESKPVYSWCDAVVRYLKENAHKRSIESDKMHLRWLDKHLRCFQLHEIDRDIIDEIAQLKEDEGVKKSTVNRVLEILRALLRKAHQDWEWIDKVPVIRMRVCEKNRVRWLTEKEASRLLKELPPHLRDMAAFTLATGLRASNVTGLHWEDVDIEHFRAWVHADQAKTKKAFAVPLNDTAIAILKQQVGKHPKFVFTYEGRPFLGKCSTKAWRNALKRADIENFRWHDLRHTWASWHVQSGTSLQELKQLGGWSNLEMVLRYAHLSSDHLQSAAGRVSSSVVTEVIKG